MYKRPISMLRAIDKKIEELDMAKDKIFKTNKLCPCCYKKTDREGMSCTICHESHLAHIG